MGTKDLDKLSHFSGSKSTELRGFRVIQKLIRLKVKPPQPIVLGVRRKGITEREYWPRINFAALIDMRDRRITMEQAFAIHSAYEAALEHFQKYRKWPGYDCLDKILNELRQHPQKPRTSAA